MSWWVKPSQPSILLKLWVKLNRIKTMETRSGFVYFCLIYSLVRNLNLISDFFTVSENVNFQIISIVFIIITILSLTAYGCGFNMDSSSVLYMLSLIYFRSSRCHREIVWQNFNGINNPIMLQPTMPPETRAVTRTMYFSVLYLCLAVLLLIFSIMALGEFSVSHHVVNKESSNVLPTYFFQLEWGKHIDHVGASSSATFSHSSSSPFVSAFLTFSPLAGFSSSTSTRTMSMASCAFSRYLTLTKFGRFYCASISQHEYFPRSSS